MKTIPLLAFSLLSLGLLSFQVDLNEVSNLSAVSTGEWFQIGGTTNTAGTGVKVGDTKTGPTGVNSAKVGDTKTGPTGVNSAKVGDTKTGSTSGVSTKTGTSDVGLKTVGSTVYSNCPTTWVKDGQVVCDQKTYTLDEIKAITGKTNLTQISGTGPNTVSSAKTGTSDVGLKTVGSTVYSNCPTTWVKDGQVVCDKKTYTLDEIKAITGKTNLYQVDGTILNTQTSARIGNAIQTTLNSAPKSGLGCTVPKADNYNPNALMDDGSCRGCLDRNNKEKYVGDIYVSKIRTTNNTCKPSPFIPDYSSKSCVTGIFGPEEEIVWLIRPQSQNDSNYDYLTPISSSTSTKPTLNIKTASSSSPTNPFNDSSSPEEKPINEYYEYELSGDKVIVPSSFLSQSEVEIMQKYGGSLYDLQTKSLVQYDRENQDPYKCKQSCHNTMAMNYNPEGAHFGDTCKFAFQPECLDPDASNTYTGTKPKAGEGKPLVRDDPTLCEYEEEPEEEQPNTTPRNCRSYVSRNVIEIIYNPDDEPTHKSCGGFGGGAYSIVSLGGGIRQVECNLVKEICSDSEVPNNTTKPKIPSKTNNENNNLCSESTANPHQPKRDGESRTFVSGGECNLVPTPAARSFNAVPQSNNTPRNNTPQPSQKPTFTDRLDSLADWLDGIGLIKKQNEERKTLPGTFDKDEKENKAQENDVPEVEKTPEEKLADLEKEVERQRQVEEEKAQGEEEAIRQKKDEEFRNKVDEILNDEKLSDTKKRQELEDLGLNKEKSKQYLEDYEESKKENPGKERPNDRQKPPADPNFAQGANEKVPTPPVSPIKPPFQLPNFVNNFVNNPNVVGGAVAGNPTSQIPANDEFVKFPWQQPAGTPPSSLAAQDEKTTNDVMSEKEKDELFSQFMNNEKTSSELKEEGFDVAKYVVERIDERMKNSENVDVTYLEKLKEFSEETLRKENPELDSKLVELDKKISDEQSKVDKAIEVSKDDLKPLKPEDDYTLEELEVIKEKLIQQGKDQSVGIEAAKNRNELQEEKEKLIKEAATQKQQAIDDETRKLLDKPLVTQSELVVNRNGKLVLTETPNIGSDTLREGSAGPHVEALKTFLAGTGFLTPDQINSDFDITTKDAVTEFQNSVGLKPDGVVGKNTKAIIDRLSDSLVLQNQVLAQKEIGISSDNKFADTKIVKGEKIKIEGEIAAHTDGNNVFSHLSAWHQNQTSSGLPPHIPGVVLPRVDFSPDGKNSKIMTDEDGNPVGDLGDVFLATFTNDYGQSVTKALVANETGGVWGPDGRYDDRNFGEFDISTMLDLKFNHSWGIGIDYQSLQMPAGTKVEIQKTNLNISNEEEYKDALEKLATEGLITTTKTTKFTPTRDYAEAEAEFNRIVENLRDSILENSPINPITGNPHGDKSIDEKPIVTQSGSSQSASTRGLQAKGISSPTNNLDSQRDVNIYDHLTEDQAVIVFKEMGEQIEEYLPENWFNLVKVNIEAGGTPEESLNELISSTGSSEEVLNGKFKGKDLLKETSIDKYYDPEIIYLPETREGRLSTEKLPGLFPSEKDPKEGQPGWYAEGDSRNNSTSNSNGLKAKTLGGAVGGAVDKVVDKVVSTWQEWTDEQRKKSEELRPTFDEVNESSATDDIQKILNEAADKDYIPATDEEKEAARLAQLKEDLYSKPINLPGSGKIAVPKENKVVDGVAGKILESTLPNTSNESISDELLNDIMELYLGMPEEDRPTIKELEGMIEDKNIAGLYPNNTTNTSPPEKLSENNSADKTQPVTSTDMADQIVEALLSQDINPGDLEKAINEALSKTSSQEDLVVLNNEDTGFNFSGIVDGVIGNALGFLGSLLPEGLGRGRDQNNANQSVKDEIKVTTGPVESEESPVDNSKLFNGEFYSDNNNSDDPFMSAGGPVVSPDVKTGPVETEESPVDNSKLFNGEFYSDNNNSDDPFMSAGGPVVSPDVKTGPVKPPVTQTNGIKFSTAPHPILETIFGLDSAGNRGFSVIPTSITELVNPLPEDIYESSFLYEKSFNPSVFSPGDLKIEPEYPSLNPSGLSPQNIPLSPTESVYDKPVFSSPAVKESDTNLRAVPIPESDLQPQDRNSNWIKESGLQIEGEYKGTQPTVPKGSETLFNLSKYLESVGIEF